MKRRGAADSAFTEEKLRELNSRRPYPFLSGLLTAPHLRAQLPYPAAAAATPPSASLTTAGWESAFPYAHGSQTLETESVAQPPPNTVIRQAHVSNAVPGPSCGIYQNVHGRMGSPQLPHARAEYSSELYNGLSPSSNPPPYSATPRHGEFGGSLTAQGVDFPLLQGFQSGTQQMFLDAHATQEGPIFGQKESTFVSSQEMQNGMQQMLFDGQQTLQGPTFDQQSNQFQPQVIHPKRDPQSFANQTQTCFFDPSASQSVDEFHLGAGQSPSRTDSNPPPYHQVVAELAFPSAKIPGTAAQSSSRSNFPGHGTSHLYVQHQGNRPNQTVLSSSSRSSSCKVSSAAAGSATTAATIGNQAFPACAYHESKHAGADRVVPSNVTVNFNNFGNSHIGIDAPVDLPLNIDLSDFPAQNQNQPQFH